jgi:hypothetical protein
MNVLGDQGPGGPDCGPSGAVGLGGQANRIPSLSHAAGITLEG